LIAFLNALSLKYKTISWLVLKKRSLNPKSYEDCYIISVDNLSFGGTGKTALVMALGEYLKERKIRFAVILRGYRSRLQNRGARVEPGHGVEEVGDEAVLYRLHFPENDVFIGRNRHRSIEMARQRKNKIMILDDGFQSASIRKNIKIMLLNPRHPYYYLRHFRFLIRGEDIILIYGARTGAGSQTLPMKSGYSFVPAGFVDSRNRPLDIGNTPIAGFAALGDNHRFVEDLSRYHLKKFKAFRDHHDFTQKDIRELDRFRDHHRARYLVCTEKDFIKLARLDLSGIPLIYLKNKLKLEHDIFSVIMNHAKESGFI
jgi:tetraacyldisaccharide 4'-kinase